MRRALFLFSLLVFQASAELPVISDSKQWLGYFVGWEERRYHYGFGADGEGLLHVIKGRDRPVHKNFKVRYQVQELIKEKWVNRKPLETDGLTSTSQAGINPEKPVPVVITVTGGTKVEFLQARSQGRIMVKPKVLEKTTSNPIRIAVSVFVPDFYRFRKEKTKRELKKEMRSGLFTAIRAADGEKIKVKLYDIEVDLTDEKMLAEGATQVSFSSSKIFKRTMTFQQGSEKAGVMEVHAKKPFYKGMRISWIADEDALKQKDCFVSFAID